MQTQVVTGPPNVRITTSMEEVGLLWMNMIDIEPRRNICRDTSKLRVPFPKTDSSSLKIGFPKRKLVFQPSIFRCHVSSGRVTQKHPRSDCFFCRLRPPNFDTLQGDQEACFGDFVGSPQLFSTSLKQIWMFFHDFTNKKDRL